MSRGGNRYGAGRPASHAKTSQYLRLDVRDLQRRRLLRAGSSFGWTWKQDGECIGTIGIQVPDDSSIILTYRRNDEPRYEAIGLWRTTCNFGGTRPWFICPECKRRVAIVYLGNATGCRRCLRLRYPSQSFDLLDRSWGRTGRIARKLGCQIVDFPRRPKGMRRRTYERLAGAWWREEEFRDEALAAFMAERYELFL
jgi:hypothetical protein